LSHSKQETEDLKKRLEKKKQRGKALTEDEETSLANAMDATKTHKLCIQRLRRAQRQLFSSLAHICDQDFPELPAMYTQDGLVQKFFQTLPAIYVPSRGFDDYIIEDPPLSLTPNSRHNVHRAIFDGEVLMHVYLMCILVLMTF
jgi:hypothetical protein